MNRAIKENSIDGESVIPEVIEDTLDDAFSLTVQFSPSGVLIATGCNDGKILVYDRTSRLYGRALMGHSGPVMCVSWLSDLCLVSGGADGTVCVWQNDGESEETRRQPTIRLCYGAPVLSISAATTGLQIIVNCLGMMPIINEIGTASPRVWQLPITPTDRVVEAFVSPTCTDTDTDARTTTGNTGKMYCEAVGTVLATDHIASTETTGKTGTKTDTQAEADMGRSTRTEMPTHIEAAINTDVIANTTTHADGEKRTCTGMHTSAATSTDTDNTANTGTYTTTDTNRNARTGSSTNPGTQTSANLNTNNTHPFGAASVGMRGRVPDSSGGFLSQEMYQRRHINLEQYMTVHEQPQTKNARHGHGAACKSTCVHTRTLTPTTEDTQTYNNTAIYSTASGHVVYVATFEGRIMQVNLRTERVMLSVSLNKAAVAIRTIQCSKDGTLLLVTCSLRSLFLLNTSTMTVIDELKEAIDAQIWHCAILSPCNQYIVAAKTPGNMPMHKLFVWEIRTAMIIKQLEGPSTEGVVSLTWHPHVPGMIASVSSAGLCYVWNASVRESWSAYTTGFTELKFNIIYTEREDEFDSEVPITKEEVMGTNPATESNPQPDIKIKAETRCEKKEVIRKPLWSNGRRRGKRGRGKRGSKHRVLDRKEESLLAQNRERVDSEFVSVAGEGLIEGSSTSIGLHNAGVANLAVAEVEEKGRGASVSGDIAPAEKASVVDKEGIKTVPNIAGIEDDDGIIVDIVTVGEADSDASDSEFSASEFGGTVGVEISGLSESTESPKNTDGALHTNASSGVPVGVGGGVGRHGGVVKSQTHSTLQSILPWFHHNFPYPEEPTFESDETEKAWNRDDIHTPTTATTHYASPYKRPNNHNAAKKPQDLTGTEEVECDHAKCAQLDIQRHGDEDVSEKGDVSASGRGVKRRRCSVLMRGHRGGGNGLLLSNDAYNGWRMHRGERALLRAYQLHNT